MEPLNTEQQPYLTEPLPEQNNLLRTEYIQLLNDKDVLLQWAKPRLEASYMVRIGYLQLERLQLQLRIKALKRKMELVRAAISQEKPIDITEIELQVAAELAQAESRILNEVAKLETSKLLLSHLSSPERSADLRKLYKQMARQLHPDLNDLLTEQQLNLWHLVKEAYETGDLEKLKSLQWVYEKELTVAGNKIADLSGEELTLKIEVLKEGIRVLQGQLLQIKNEFPFTIELQLKDDDWINAQTHDIKTELEKLQQYVMDLTTTYQQIMHVL